MFTEWWIFLFDTHFLYIFKSSLISEKNLVKTVRIIAVAQMYSW